MRTRALSASTRLWPSGGRSVTVDVLELVSTQFWVW